MERIEDKDFFEKLGLEKVPKEYIDLIMKYKPMWSILEFEKHDEGFKEENNTRYQKTLNLNHEDISSDMYNNIVSILKELKTKVDEIHTKNQRLIDHLVELIIMNLAEALSDNETEEITCARIFQYVTKSLKYSEDLYNYEYMIPFASKYRFCCYNGIPMGKNFEDILVTKEGTSFEIANLITFLGKVFDIDIKTVPAIYNNGLFYINSTIIDGKVSYIDATSAMMGKDESKCCLVSVNELNENGVSLNYAIEKYDDGIKRKINMRHGSRIDMAISRERNELPEKAIKIKNALEEEKKKNTI